MQWRWVPDQPVWSGWACFAVPAPPRPLARPPAPPHPCRRCGRSWGAAPRCSTCRSTRRAMCWRCRRCGGARVQGGTDGAGSGAACGGKAGGGAGAFCAAAAGKQMGASWRAGLLHPSSHPHPPTHPTSSHNKHTAGVAGGQGARRLGALPEQEGRAALHERRAAGAGAQARGGLRLQGASAGRHPAGAAPAAPATWLCGFADAFTHFSHCCTPALLPQCPLPRLEGQVLGAGGAAFCAWLTPPPARRRSQGLTRAFAEQREVWAAAVECMAQVRERGSACGRRLFA